MSKAVMGAAAVAVLVGAGAAGCWYTGDLFDKQVPLQLGTAQRESGLVFQWQPTSSNLLTREADLRIELTPELASSLDADLVLDKPLELYLHTRTRIMPLYTSTEISLDMSRGDLAKTLTRMGLQNWKPVMQSHNSFWNSNTVTVLSLPEANVDSDGEQLKLMPLEMRFDGDFNGSGQVALSWAGMTYRQPSQQVECNIGRVDGTAELKAVDNILMVPSSQAKVAGFSLNVGEGMKFDMQGMTSSSTLQGDSADTLASHYQLGIGQFKMAMEGETVELADTALDAHIKGMDMKGYHTLLQANADPKKDEAKLQMALDQLLARGATLELTNLAAKVNQAPVSLKGNLVLAPTTLEKLTGGDEGLNALNGQFAAELSNKLGQALPQVAPWLEHLGSIGYLKSEGDLLKADIQLAKGAVTINGQPL
ncbi:Uncharacterized conserved protein YdgA, DUF945 family [Aeromonas sp. RU39B]|uniref:DUF945 family protein n=1 Tax=Aeromonas sp. RU39B TaxID=1907416 RepID=UPI00095683F1|nr:DUF945 family protein [Aeromonas sp. RU39B]SIR41734.1 Uncharacterized conserved protein YdgA, DUF945 family [Aeromonas sp. RU39B]